MYSTEQPPLLIGFRRAHLTVFWLGAASAVTLVGGGAAWAAAIPGSWAVGAGAAVVMLAPGLWSRRWFEFGVRAWNAGARHLAAFIQAYALWVVYYVVIAPVGRMQRSVEPRPRHGRSQWNRRRAGAVLAGGEAATAAQALAAFGGSRPRVWSQCLIPLVVLIANLNTDPPDATPPAATYTLY